MSKKLIIVFEGIECSGKSYQINQVAKYLKSIGRPYINIREPGGNINSEKIRKLLLSNKVNFNNITDLLLYFASRSENIENVIKKNLGKKIILIDRFTDSTLAYQHYGMGINKEFIQKINKFLLKDINVNFTFLNTVSIKNMKIRLSKRKNLNRYDKLPVEFYRKVQLGFVKISNLNRGKYLKINSNLDISLNKNIIINKIKKLIK